MSPLVGQQQQDWEEQVEVDYLVRLQLLENGGFGFGISQGNPCEVSAVQSNTLAEQLGVRMGDVIVAIAGVACRDVQDSAAALHYALDPNNHLTESGTDV
eukprot:SAG25_NODE_10866_length_321_cov_0.689189_1_plen_99_part_01